MTNRDNYESEIITDLVKALYKAKGSIRGPKKNKSNPAFKSSYADLEAVLEAVEGPAYEAGLIIIQTPISEEEEAGADTRLIHVPTGQYIGCRTTYRMRKGGPQDAGSCTSYARRYQLLCLFGLAPVDDDDGNAGQARYRATKPSRPTKRRPAERHDAAALAFINDNLLGLLRSSSADESAVVYDVLREIVAKPSTHKGQAVTMGDRLTFALRAASEEALDDRSSNTADLVPLRDSLLNPEDLDETGKLAWLALVRTAKIGAEK